MGSLVNTLTVICGSLLGMWIGKRLPESLYEAIMKGLGLCTIYLGIRGFHPDTHPLLLIISLVLGTIIGEWADLDAQLNKLGEKIKSRLPQQSKGNFTEGFVTATLLFCVGAMTILGCIQDGLRQDHTILYAKSTLDFVSSTIFASTLGLGVLFAAGSVLLIQGSLTLAAVWLAPYLSEPVINDISTVGSLLIVALGLNLLGATQLKVMNYLPACLMPVFIHLIMPK